ncbi:DNA repair protein RecO [uncultured Traorella sp.]|uniref:DNA repair protein RecO n=1 Tax=uncultured Traorella sp. TaxID=1929048 RepID=UPI0025FC519B|nr:DNA repair protein RecO [uncultured Traorella sp.]
MSDFKGIVLTNTLIHDHDVLMNVLTPFGKISMKAKGVLKTHSKNRNYTEVGCYSLFHTIDKNTSKIVLLKNAEMVKRFLNIEHDLIRKSIYSCFLEIMNKTDICFEDALQYIEILDSCANPYCIYALLLCEVLRSSGVSIVVDACVLCSSEKGLCALSIPDGGFVCVHCFDQTRHYHLSVDELKNLRYAAHASLENYQALEAASTLSFQSVSYLVELLHRYGEITLRSHAFLEVLQPLA